ncbi:MAG: aspartate aminotransferase family protein [Rhodothermales bacterium]
MTATTSTHPAAMTRDELMALEDRLQLPTYNKLPIVVDRAEGSWLWDLNGNKYLDFYGGHCVALLGHTHPRVVKALQEQSKKILFYSNLVYSPVRARATEKLMRLAPPEMHQVFFCSTGTEANETALKLARKATGRGRVVAADGDFHGRTMGSLAATSFPKYRAGYEKVFPDTVFVPFGDAEALEQALAHPDGVAAFIIEPIQSMAGVTTAPASYFRAVRELCDRAGTKLVFDEVQTGVGRTGTFSISDHFGMRPDMITLAKSLGSGIPVGAVLVNEAVASSVSFGDQGTTFGGGMMPMAAMEATMDALLEDGIMERASIIHDRIRDGISSYGGTLRGAGCLIGLEASRPVGPIVAGLRKEGVIVGGSLDPNVMRLMPPLTATNEEVDFFIDAFSRVVEPILAADA